MAASMIIEEETGTYTATQRHPHNGYYAGDFSYRTACPDGLPTTAAEPFRVS